MVLVLVVMVDQVVEEDVLLVQAILLQLVLHKEIMVRQVPITLEVVEQQQLDKRLNLRALEVNQVEMD